jgi:hypothetical protein
MIAINTLRGFGFAAASALALLEPVTALAYTDTFAGYYAPGNWTTSSPQATPGSWTHTSATVSAADYLTITGPAGSNLSGYYDIAIQAAFDGTWSFKWAYNPNGDILTRDTSYYFTTTDLSTLTTRTQLATNNSTIKTGTKSFSVTQGTWIGFSVFSSNGNLTPGILTISSFAAPLPDVITPPNGIPEPSSLSLLAISALGLTLTSQKLGKIGKSNA